jgi:hypothetical protein
LFQLCPQVSVPKEDKQSRDDAEIVRDKCFVFSTAKQGYPGSNRLTLLEVGMRGRGRGPSLALGPPAAKKIAEIADIARHRRHRKTKTLPLMTLMALIEDGKNQSRGPYRGFPRIGADPGLADSQRPTARGGANIKCGAGENPA